MASARGVVLIRHFNPALNASLKSSQTERRAKSFRIDVANGGVAALG
jgi:hypothetical protein